MLQLEQALVLLDLPLSCSPFLPPALGLLVASMRLLRLSQPPASSSRPAALRLDSLGRRDIVVWWLNAGRALGRRDIVVWWLNAGRSFPGTTSRSSTVRNQRGIAHHHARVGRASHCCVGRRVPADLPG